MNYTHVKMKNRQKMTLKFVSIPFLDKIFWYN